MQAVKHHLSCMYATETPCRSLQIQQCIVNSEIQNLLGYYIITDAWDASYFWIVKLELIKERKTDTIHYRVHTSIHCARHSSLLTHVFWLSFRSWMCAMCLHLPCKVQNARRLIFYQTGNNGGVDSCRGREYSILKGDEGYRHLLWSQGGMLEE